MALTRNNNSVVIHQEQHLWSKCLIGRYVSLINRIALCSYNVTALLDSPLIRVDPFKEGFNSEVPPLVFELPTSDENVPISTHNDTPCQLDSFRSVDDSLELAEGRQRYSLLQPPIIGFGIDLSQLTQCSNDQVSELITDRNLLRTPPATERRAHRERFEPPVSCQSRYLQNRRPATARPSIYTQTTSTADQQPSQFINQMIENYPPGDEGDNYQSKPCHSSTASSGPLSLSLGKCFAASLLCSPRTEPQHQRAVNQHRT